MQKYNLQQTWQWNLDNAPDISVVKPPIPLAGTWSWCGIPVASPLGIPAGPLLNSRWLLHYANRGFDILVYKTVRSIQRDCYPLPNLVPVATAPMSNGQSSVPLSESMDGSWAVSFGMPSQAPEVWRRDVAFTRRQLPDGKVLVVSVVGTQDESITDEHASLDHLADDFAKCARWAMESGAHGIEANFSCPNVSTADGQLFQKPTAARLVAERIRGSIGDAPLVLKVGRVATTAEAAELMTHVAPYVNGLAMTNSIAATVTRADGGFLFEGQPRGICGDATRVASLAQTAMFRDLLRESHWKLDLIGVGGISKAEHVEAYIAAGATSVAIATAAMVNPDIGIDVREGLS